jgi:hypothetical protein
VDGIGEGTVAVNAALTFVSRAMAAGVVAAADPEDRGMPKKIDSF